MPSTVKHWWETYHAAVAPFIRLQEADAAVTDPERAWGLARAMAARVQKNGGLPLRILMSTIV